MCRPFHRSAGKVFGVTIDVAAIVVDCNENSADVEEICFCIANKPFPESEASVLITGLEWDKRSIHTDTLTGQPGIENGLFTIICTAWRKTLRPTI